jgi:hypothetical protein
VQTGTAQAVIVRFQSILLEHDLIVLGDQTNSGDVAVGGDLDVTGTGTFGSLECTTSNLGTDLAVDGTLTVTGTTTLNGAMDSTLVNAAGASANPWDFTGTLGIMNGSDDFTAIDINITNADHTGSNTIQGVDIGAITGDDQATETALMVGTGWDAGLDLNGTPVVIGADGGVTLDETSDDVVALSTGAGAGTVSVLVGNLKVGNGTPGTAQDGEDAYVEGGLEVDGTAKLDGAVNIGGNTDVAGTLQYGASNLYPVGYASSGYKVVTGITPVFTGTVGITHGLSVVTSVQVSLCQDSAAAAAGASVTISGTTVTAKSWKSDGSTAADVGTTVCYTVIGTP